MLSGTKASAAFEQGGLLDQLKKALAERALNAEMDHHLAGDGGAGNSRKGYGRKTVVTDTGRMALEVPRDRQGSLAPLPIAKYQRRFPGFDDKIKRFKAYPIGDFHNDIAEVRTEQGKLDLLVAIDRTSKFAFA